MSISPEAGGGIFIIANVLLFWFREWLKHRTWNKNGKALNLIKNDIKLVTEKLITMDGKAGKTTTKIAEVKVAVDNQAKHCKETVNRFDETIRGQNQSIIDLAGRKR